VPSDHAKISYIKSTIRILGYGAMTAVGHRHPCIVLAGVLLIIAEFIGIVEEFGH
jgi:hypothetical protein